jgi:hypothetical protein
MFHRLQHPHLRHAAGFIHADPELGSDAIRAAGFGRINPRSNQLVSVAFRQNEVLPEPSNPFFTVLYVGSDRDIMILLESLLGG